MKLSLTDRLNLLPILPKEGDIINLRIIRDLQQDLSLSETEKTSFEVKSENGYIIWNAKGVASLKEVPIGENAKTIIKDVLTERNKQKKLNTNLIGLYERFVENKQTVEDFEEEKKKQVANKSVKAANKDVQLPVKP